MDHLSITQQQPIITQGKLNELLALRHTDTVTYLTDFIHQKHAARGAKPHRITRLIVWLASLAGILGVLHSTNIAGQIFALIFLARATYLLGMSLKYGVGGTSKLDLYCLGLGILALATYVTTKNGLLTISLGILADVIGYIPTFVKTYHKPKSEDPLFFAIEGVASLFGVFAVWEWSAAILFPIYFTLCSGLVVFLIYRKRIFPGWR